MADAFAYHIYMRQSGFVVRGVGKWHRMEVEGRATMPLILHLWGFLGDPGALGILRRGDHGDQAQIFNDSGGSRETKWNQVTPIEI